MLTAYGKSQKQCVLEYNEWKRKQEDEERKLAEKYGMPYKENESIK